MTAATDRGRNPITERPIEEERGREMRRMFEEASDRREMQIEAFTGTAEPERGGDGDPTGRAAGRWGLGRGP